MNWIQTVSKAVIWAVAAVALVALALVLMLIDGRSATASDETQEVAPPNAVVTATAEPIAPVVDRSVPAVFDAADISGPVAVLDTDTDVVTEYGSYDLLVTAFEAKGRALIVGDQQLTKTDAANAPDATYVLATFYADAGYSGSTLMATTSISTYCTSHSYTGNLTGSWNNRVSSFSTYGNCRSEVYENTSQGGSSYGPAVQASSLGVMNDQASSYKIVD